jgi:hypothetical protein
MPRLVDNLQGQLVLLIIAALAVAQTISLWLFVDERGLAVRAALGFEAAGHAQVARQMPGPRDGVTKRLDSGAKRRHHQPVLILLGECRVIKEFDPKDFG